MNVPIPPVTTMNCVRTRRPDEVVTTGVPPGYSRTGFLPEQVRRPVPTRLLTKRGDQVTATPDGGKPCYIVDQFLRVHGGDLAADLRKRVHDCH